MRSLITGASGFAGSHLADYLLSLPDSYVCGCSVDAGRPDYLDERVELVTADLRDPAQADALLARFNPDRVYHLAGQASVRYSLSNAWDTLETNIRSQLNLFEAILRLDLRPRVLVVGSMEEYGRLRAEDLPVREEAPLRPDNPYGLSKVAQDLMGLQYFISRRLEVVRMRPFNHIGPRQNNSFVAATFAHQIARAEAGLQPPVVKVGNLDVRRDFTDARDVARAYSLAMERGQPGEVYNVCSGRARSIGEVLEGLMDWSSVGCKVEVDPGRVRPSDTPVQRGDATKLRAATGWQPQIPFEQSLRDLLDYERQKVAKTYALALHSVASRS